MSEKEKVLAMLRNRARTQSTEVLGMKTRSLVIKEFDFDALADDLIEYFTVYLPSQPMRPTDTTPAH